MPRPASRVEKYCPFLTLNSSTRRESASKPYIDVTVAVSITSTASSGSDPARPEHEDKATARAVIIVAERALQIVFFAFMGAKIRISESLSTH
jgi:hypothetical protein